MIPVTTEKKLDDIDKKILNLIADGKSVKEIAWKVGMKARQVDYRIKAMRKYYECTSVPQLIIKLQEQL